MYFLSISLKTLKDYLKTYIEKYVAVLAFRPTGESHVLFPFGLLALVRKFWCISIYFTGWTYSENIGNQLDLIRPISRGNVTIYGKIILRTFLSQMHDEVPFIVLVALNYEDMVLELFEMLNYFQLHWANYYKFTMRAITEASLFLQGFHIVSTLVSLNCKNLFRFGSRNNKFTDLCKTWYISPWMMWSQSFAVFEAWQDNPYRQCGECYYSRRDAVLLQAVAQGLMSSYWDESHFNFCLHPELPLT